MLKQDIVEQLGKIKYPGFSKTDKMVLQGRLPT